MLSFDVDAFVAAVNDIPTEDVSSSSPTTAALAEPVRDELVEELRKAVKDLQEENNSAPLTMVLHSVLHTVYLCSGLHTHYTPTTHHYTYV